METNDADDAVDAHYAHDAHDTDDTGHTDDLLLPLLVFSIARITSRGENSRYAFLNLF